MCFIHGEVDGPKDAYLPELPCVPHELVRNGIQKDLQNETLTDHKNCQVFNTFILRILQNFIAYQTSETAESAPPSSSNSQFCKPADD